MINVDDVDEYISVLNQGGEGKKEAAIDLAKAAASDPSVVKRAVPDLQKCLRSEPVRARAPAADALARVGLVYPDEAIAAKNEIIDLLGGNVRININSALRYVITLELEESRSRVEPLVNHSNKPVQYTSKLALATIDGETPRYGSYLLALRSAAGKNKADPITGIRYEDICESGSKSGLKNLISIMAGDAYLISLSQNMPASLHPLIPDLVLEIQNPDRPTPVALRALRHYAEEYPNRCLGFVPSVVPHLDHTSDSVIGNAIGFLLAVAKENYSAVKQYQEIVAPLCGHSEEYIREPANEFIEIIPVTNTAKIEQTNSDGRDFREKNDREGLNHQQKDHDIEELRKSAERAAEDSPKQSKRRTNRVTQEYRRSHKVREYVLARADGLCEGCRGEAPFVGTDGRPYLQAHHVDELADGGSDTLENVIALCPNCHYRVHHGCDGDDYNEILRHLLRSIEVSN